ncbi:hypothetical protein [Sphingomonas quercus]|uniref:hypothetical protein n=1 Tax=Sphingomonas quercus TaxID=2842451 RepID=UPI003F4DF4DB
MWLFGKKARAGVRPALGRAALPLIGSWPGHYDQQLREAMATNPVAQRAVRLVVEGCARPRSMARAPRPRRSWRWRGR